MVNWMMVVPSLRGTPCRILWPDWDKPVAFIPQDGEDTADFEGNSRCNRDEAGIVLQVARGLLETGDLSAKDIGIITPYNGQVRLLRSLFEKRKKVILWKKVFLISK